MVDATEEPRVDMELKCKALNVTEMEKKGEAKLRKRSEKL